MKIPRRSLSLIFPALVVLSSSVFLFGGKVYAEAPLKDNEVLIQKKTEKVTKKSTELKTTTQTIQQLLDKKQTLAQQLDSAQQQVDDLNQQLADKKAAEAAEAARLEAVKNMFVHVTLSASNSAGNLYDAGYCTWYVKNKRPDLPNNLGNANQWYYNAAAMGYNVGSTPKKGAVGTTTRGAFGHVVYVEGVSLDGQTITISEMNYAGLYSLRTRSADASEFQYIYELN